MKFLSIFVIFLLFLSTASVMGGTRSNSAPALDVPASVDIEFVGQGESKSTTFTITNTGDVNITLETTSITFTQSNFTDNDGDLITLTFSDYFGKLLIPTDSLTATVNAAPTDKVDINTYTGIVTVTDADTGATDSFTLSVLVGPELCERGEVGDLDISVDNPDDGDEFKPNENINIEVDVENNAGNDLDVTVQAILVDLTDGSEIEDAESDEINIDEDERETFDLEMKVPIDPDEIDPSHDYAIFFKAFEDEDEQCDEDFKEIDIELEKHDMIVESVTFTPSIAKKGELVTARVKVLNIGESDEDNVFVRLRETGILGLDVESTPVDNIQEFKEEDDNSATISLTFTVPDNAEDGDYNVNVAVIFDDGDETSDTFQTLTVSGEVVEEPVEEEPAVKEPVVIEDSFDLSQKTTAEPTGFAFLSSLSPFSPRSWSILTLGIADVVLVILGIYLIVLIFRRI